uniref:SFRICE_009946 n=1 Tax=Spodoptera frugiperda TaxID=7108 RepID=A0A2H1UZZ7_SPOFR
MGVHCTVALRAIMCTSVYPFRNKGQFGIQFVVINDVLNVPDRCASVCTWLSAVVRCHSALLLATMGSRASDHLTQLLAIFTNRRSHLCQLLNLKGRLDLTISQRSASDIAQDEQEPVLNYNGEFYNTIYLSAAREWNSLPDSVFPDRRAMLRHERAGSTAVMTRPHRKGHSSSDEEMEAEPYQSDSDASWGDDKFESDASAQEEADSDGD